jgi:Ca-activated chloride channel family protein
VVADKSGIDDATDFVRELKALGGTNIAEALTTALSFKRDDTRPFYVAFITDGRPTVGVTQLGGILELVEGALEGAKIFALGVGYNVNTHLIDKLAQVSKGISEYVKPEEDLELTVSDFYAKLSHPALTDISIDFGEAGVHGSYPRIFPDLFYGSQIVIIGKYCNPGLQTVVLKGTRQGREESFERELEFPLAADFPSLPRLWAKRRVGHLLDEIRLHGEDQELVDEIVELGKRYGIVTPYTSFLVTEDELVHAPDVISEKQALTAPTGRGAFRAAETLGKMKRDVLVFSEGEEALSIRIIGEKVFYLEESVWVDSEYTEDTDEKVLILWSDEFIDFLREHPEVGRYVSLGDEVIFIHGEVAYRVRP